ncbi:MotA/TolQ/ExbB proton channel domain-containing protein [Bordetella tumbae]
MPGLCRRFCFSYEFAVNFLTNLGASLQFIAFAKQQLQGLHALIDTKKIPVEKSEDFFEQTSALEQALGDQAYGQSFNRYKSAKKGLVVGAGTILAIALIVYGLSMFGPTSGLIKGLMSDFILFATTISIVAGLLLIGIIAGCFYIRSLETKLLGKDLSALWARILQRWAPELAAKQDFATIDPESIAQFVTVQAKIQDVNLDLN